MINRLFTILGSEVNSFLSNWEKDLKFRKKEKTTSYKSSSNKNTNPTKNKRKKASNSIYTKKELQAFMDLELKPTKDKIKIKKQFKSQIKKYHPDKHQDLEKKKIAETITKRLISSYELLCKK